MTSEYESKGVLTQNSENELTYLASDIGKDGITRDSKSYKINDKSNYIERILPKINCEEKIIFAVDLCCEEDNTLFSYSEGDFSFFQMVKKVLPLYMNNKKVLGRNHKYALMVLLDHPIWITDFTDNPKKILNEISKLKEVTSSSSFDLSRLFDAISTNVTLPKISDENSASPDYIIRTILIYGRSHCIPQFLNGKEAFMSLTRNPHFFVDILYAHEPQSDNNKCEGIFELLCNLDERGCSYVLEVTRDAISFYNVFASLLAHPLQRTAQKEAQYDCLMSQTIQ